MPDPRSPSRTLGRQGEEVAARELERRGYLIVGRNVRTRAGEIDLVAERRGELVFVEVKSRSGAGGGLVDGALAVGPAKQRRLARAAEAYLQRRGGPDRACRFDVAVVTWAAGTPRVEWILSAFQAVT